jgi:hypothetical protein
MYRNRILRMLLVLLLMFSFALTVPVASGQRRYRRYRNAEAGKRKLRNVSALALPLAQVRER